MSKSILVKPRGTSRAVNKAGQTHDQLQAACFKWALQAYHPYLYRRFIAIPNDATNGNVRLIKHYEALGVTAGAWDMVLHWFEATGISGGSGISIEPQSFYKFNIIPTVTWFEFKVGNDTLKKETQIPFAHALTPLFHKFYVIREEPEFQSALKIIVEPTLKIAKELFKE